MCRVDDFQGPCGLMDKALIFGTKDCRFESCQGHTFQYSSCNDDFIGSWLGPMYLLLQMIKFSNVLEWANPILKVIASIFFSKCFLWKHGVGFTASTAIKKQQCAYYYHFGGCIAREGARCIGGL